MYRLRSLMFCVFAATIAFAFSTKASARTGCYYSDACFYSSSASFSKFISFDVPSGPACDALCANEGHYDDDFDFCECHNIVVSLEVHDGTHKVTTDNMGGEVRGDATGTGDTEKLQLVNWDNHVLHDGDYVSFVNYGGYAFSMDSEDGDPLMADHTSSLGNPQKFIINTIDCSDCDISSGDAVLLRNIDTTRYWSAVNGGGDVIEVGPNDWGTDETFRIWFE